MLFGIDKNVLLWDTVKGFHATAVLQAALNNTVWESGILGSNHNTARWRCIN